MLQAPRGNLEAVAPRALVLPAVAAALDAGDYAGGCMRGGTRCLRRGRALRRHACCLPALPSCSTHTPRPPHAHAASARSRPPACPAPGLLPPGAEAWALATANRLDLNVLADYRWPRLLGAADAFVAQVRRLLPCLLGGRLGGLLLLQG